MTVVKFRALFGLTRLKTHLLPKRRLHYVQGQSPKPNVREYFYYIDHHGQLFLDDARMKNFTSCFKDVEFLEFFFKRLKINDTGKYDDEFPYFSPCGREKNYVRCDDLPVVFTQVLNSENHEEPDKLSYCGTGKRMTVIMEPEKVCMLPWNGRIYHPGPDHLGGIGLIKSAMAIEWSKSFEFGPEGEYSPPTHFSWKGQKYTLTNELVKIATRNSPNE